jgi:hypothetical protein
VSVFTLQLWREWREHRSALLALLLVLPLGTWLLSQPLPRGALGDPFFRAAVALGFVLVMLVAVGGELLGAERRGRGLGWLERLPSGLAGAFGAKLVLFLVTTTGVAAYGYGSACLVGLLRGTHASANPLFRELVPLTLLAAAWALWTFAASTWTLRGGLALFAAALVLGALAFPIWRVMHAGYNPTLNEILWLFMGHATSPLIGAWLGYVIGSRRGVTVWPSVLLGLAPATVALAVTMGWSALRMSERAAFDPLAGDFRAIDQTVTEDGRTALVIGGNELWRWNSSTTPLYVLRVDLEHGSFHTLGRMGERGFIYRRPIEGASGTTPQDELVVEVEGREPLAFDIRTGELRPGDPKTKFRQPRRWKGLGRIEWDGSRAPSVIHDPFRERDYPVRALGDLYYRGDLWVRPGRWLHKPAAAASWFWFEPDTGAEEPVAWPAHSEPLVLFEDGRILIANATEGLQVVHPEHDDVRTVPGLDVRVDQIFANHNGFRVPFSNDLEAAAGGTIVLLTHRDGWLVLDAEATSVRRLPINGGVRIKRRLGPDTAIVENRNDGSRLARLDLVSGSMTRLWPKSKESR